MEDCQDPSSITGRCPCRHHDKCANDEYCNKDRRCVPLGCHAMQDAFNGHCPCTRHSDCRSQETQQTGPLFCDNARRCWSVSECFSGDDSITGEYPGGANMQPGAQGNNTNGGANQQGDNTNSGANMPPPGEGWVQQGTEWVHEG